MAHGLPRTAPALLGLALACGAAPGAQAAAPGDRSDSPEENGARLPWPEYRGPHGDGQAGGADPPLVFGDDENLRWRRALTGDGHSSPVVGEGRLWLTESRDDGRQLRALAFDAEGGHTLVDRVVFENPAPQPIRNPMNGYASPSPVLAAGRVFVHFGTAGTACLDATDGRTLWERRDLPCEHLEGPGSSPVLLGETLYFHADGADTQSLVALDARSGRTLWRRPRSLDLDRLAPALRKAYGTPLIAEVLGRVQLVSTAAGASMGYDPCSGRELWRVRHGGYSMSSRPLVAAVVPRGTDRITPLALVNTGYDRPELWAVAMDQHGDVTDSAVRWRHDRRVANMSSPLLLPGADGAPQHLFMVADNGVGSVLDLADGELLWQRRLLGPTVASPVRCDGGGLGRIYLCDRDGQTLVITDQVPPQVLARNRLETGCTASPALAGGALFLRTQTHLYRFERRP